ncbi:nuclear transport factor 2 family protein [Candidatus Enterococcus ferrettii]|uniref:SnoaL-like domain-containing protein n=1 Tax=Candidatus Enterococcus ferrettii TaxID=2815324 RepID=A0ABV0EP25_9ENTE|nr:nuclear transport factor 2 family protein [Enterococcus sp. 665A]MBO1342912.1 nuclear transport factor 2 family protein [Enterococcus sp. 665A]
MTEKERSFEERINALEAIEEIKRVKANYAQYLDNGYDPEGIASLFSSEGKWVIEGVAIQGTGAIKEQCKKLIRVQPWSCHNITPSIIDISDDGLHAEGSFYMLTFLTMRNNEGMDEAYFLSGIFKDKFIKENGKWYFEKVEAFVQQAAPWTKGWIEGGFAKGFFDIE